MTERMVIFYNDISDSELLVEVGDASNARINAAFIKWLGKENAGWQNVEDDGYSDVTTLEEIDRDD